MYKNLKAFVVYISSFSLMTIHLLSKVWIILLQIEMINISNKYFEYANVLSKESAKVLPKRIKINSYAIKFENASNQPISSFIV